MIDLEPTARPAYLTPRPRSGGPIPGSLFALGLALALLAACTPGGGATPGGDPGVIFRDDFSETASGWDRHSDSVITTDYADGHYVMAFDDIGQDIWARPGLDLTDLVLTVDTAYAGGPANNEYGAMCRYTKSGDKHSFYFFFVSSDGYYALGKVAKNVRTILDPATGDFQPSDAIRLGEAETNQLTVSCVGRQMSLAVNGTPVGQFEDDELTHGDIGLIIGTFDEPGVKINFDNVVVRRP